MSFVFAFICSLSLLATAQGLRPGQGGGGFGGGHGGGGPGQGPGGGNSPQIMSATYGGNCRAPRGNATFDVQRECSRQGSTCNYTVDVNRIGDPCRDVRKDIVVDYVCNNYGQQVQSRVSLPPEANGKVLSITCGGNGGGNRGLNVISATYGGNRGARLNNALNSLKSRCDGQAVCYYTISVNELGDSAPGKEKDFKYSYSCGNGPAANFTIGNDRQEANGQTITLQCR